MCSIYRASLVAVIGIIVIGLTLTGCGRKKEQQQAAPEVAIVVMQYERVPIITELPGRTSAYLIAEVRPQVNGIIKKRLFTEGGDVKAGDVLYQIDPAPYQAAYDNAKRFTRKGRSQSAARPAESRALQRAGCDQSGEPAGI